MAKKLNMQFSGTIGPLVGCLRDGKYHYRSKPGKVEQTEATKQSSSLFGLAAKAGKIMRLYLAQSIPNAKDIHMQRRLEVSISKWLRIDKTLPPKPTDDIPFVNHFNFNPELPLEEVLRIALSFKQTGPGLAELQLPVFVPVTSIKAPAGTTYLQFCISAVALRLGDDGYFGSSTVTFTIPYNNDVQQSQQIAFDLQTQPGNILIAALQIRYGVEEGGNISYRKHAARSTAAIVGALYL
ncbi:MAG: hypothetical protein ABI472_24980 [Ginsengibacter sp.]